MALRGLRSFSGLTELKTKQLFVKNLLAKLGI
jgi:hypothetical protein